MPRKNPFETQGNHKIIESPLITIFEYGGIGLCFGRGFINFLHAFSGTETPLTLSSELIITLAGGLLGLASIISPATHDKAKYAFAGVFLGLAASFYPEKDNIVPIATLVAMAIVPFIFDRQPPAHE